MHKTVELGMKGNPRALAQLIALYSAAVPEAATTKIDQSVEESARPTSPRSRTLRASWAAEGGEDQ